jgi:Ca2+-binding RTX toxin-like protein
LAAVLLGLLTSIPAASAAEPTCFGAPATITGTESADTLHGTSGDDVIVGLGGDDTIEGLGGNDRICGYSDDQGEDDAFDRIDGGPGNDSIRGSGDPTVPSLSWAVGGTGDDTMVVIGVSYEKAPRGVSVDLVDDTATGWGHDTLTDVDTVVGSSYGDKLLGNNARFVDSECGCDRLYGLGGDDVLHGRRGNDTLIGNGGDDVLSGGHGADRLFPGAGRDEVRGGPGPGIADFASFSDSAHAVTVDLVAGTATGSGRDTIRGIEGVYGGYQRDIIRGDSAANELVGGEGRDVLRGRGGPDRLRGGLNGDLLVGGTGHDNARGQGGIDTCHAEVEHTCEK